MKKSSNKAVEKGHRMLAAGTQVYQLFAPLSNEIPALVEWNRAVLEAVSRREVPIIAGRWKGITVL